MKTLQFVILTFCLTNVSFCWWDTGHMLVAKVAELTMIQESIYLLTSDREVFDHAERLTNILNIFSHNKISNFVESACWPDDVKTMGLISMDEWHFIDLPVRFPALSFMRDNFNITYKPDDALGTIVTLS